MISRSDTAMIKSRLRLAVTSIVVALLTVCSQRSVAQSAAMTVTGTLPAATVGRVYSQALQVNGGFGGVAFTMSGELPGGMSWVTSGAIPVLQGTPKVAGNYPLAVTAKDAIGQTVSWTQTLTVHVALQHDDTGSTSPTVYMNEATVGVDQMIVTIGLSVAPSTVPLGTAGTAYAGVTFTSPGGGDAVNFTESGYLPKGLTVTAGSNSMTLSGTPIQSGSYVFTINVADHAGHTGAQAYLLEIAAAPPVVITPSSIASSVGEGVNFGPYFFMASGGASSLTLSEGGGLPTGITVSFNSGVLEMFGEPTQLGTFPFTIYATDQAGASVSQNYSFTVTAPPPIAVSPATIVSSINVGSAYPSTNFQTSGGSGSGSVIMSGGSLPPGMTFACVLIACPAAIGVLSGTPTKPGSWTFEVTVTDAYLPNTSATTRYTINVTMPTLTFSPASFPDGITTESYNSSISITNLPAGYTLSLGSNLLSVGLTPALSGSTLTIQGTPQQPGASSIVLIDTDQYGNSEQRQEVINFQPAPVLTITSTTSPLVPLYTDNVSVTASFSGSYATHAITGTIVSYSVDGVSKGFAFLQSTSATLSLGRLTPATHTFSVTYGGNGFYHATTQTYSFTVALPPYALLGASHTFNSSTGQSNSAAVDSKGNLYLTDSNYNGGGYSPGIVHKLDSQGNLTTFPTTGLVNPSGIAIDGNDDVYVADTGNFRIVEITQAGVQSVLPIGGLQQPSTLAFDPSYKNLYIVDDNYGPSNVFQYNLATQATTSISTLYETGGVGVSPSGQVYIGTKPRPGHVSGVLDPGALYTYDPVAQATTQLQLSGLYSPTGLAFDHAGNLYIGDTNLFRLDSSNTVLTELSDNGGSSLAVDQSGNIDIVNGSTVAQYSPGPAGYAGAATALKGAYYSNGGSTFNLYYASPAGVTLSGTSLPTTTDFGTVSGGLNCFATSLCKVTLEERPQLPGLVRDNVTATFSDGTQLLTPIYGTAYQAEVGLSPGNTSQITTNATTYGGVTTDQNGVIYFTDSAARQVYKIVGGAPVALGFTGLRNPTQLAVDGAGAVYVFDPGVYQQYVTTNSQIVELDSTGKQSVVFDTALQSSQITVSAFALDGADNLWLGVKASDGIGSIAEFTAYNAYSIFAQGINPVTAMGFDTAGNLYTVDTAQGALKVWNRSGTSTVLATGLTSTGSMAIEPSGTIYLAGGSSPTLTQVPPGSAAVPYAIAGLSAASVVAVNRTGSLTIGDNTTHLLTLNDRTTQSFNFGSLVLGSTSSTQQTTVSNVGNLGGLTFSSLPGGNIFQQDSSSTTCNTSSTVLAAGASCHLGLYFQPTSLGVESDPGSFGTNIPTQSSQGSSFSIAITGTGISTQPVANLAATPLAFGRVAVGSSAAAQKVTLTNGGGATLHIASIATSDPAFTTSTTCGATLASLASCTVSVVFAPSAQVASSAMLIVTDDSSTGATQSVALSGTGVAGERVVVALAAGGIAAFYSNGNQQSSAAGGGIGVAIDAGGSIWSINAGGNGVSKFSNTGALTATYLGGGIAVATALAIDGAGTVWIADGGGAGISSLANTGTVQNAVPIAAGLAGPAASISVDSAGSLWLSNPAANTVVEIIGVAAPVTTPTVQSIVNSTLGAKP